MKKFKINLSRKIIAVSAFVVLAAVLCILVFRFTSGSISFADDNENTSFSALWESRQYTRLIEAGNNELKKNPMNKHALVFTGFANFYHGISILIPEERTEYMEEAVKLLRKALLTDGEVNSSVKYILGKAYYHKGRHYSNLSVKYLTEALDENYPARDIHEYLGLAYSAMGNRAGTIENFEKAAELNPGSPLLLLSLANAYIENSENEKAALVLGNMGGTGDNEVINEKRYLLEGRVCISMGNLKEAEASLKKALEINPDMVDAYFYLGLVYEAEGDKWKARKQWEKGYRTDPDYAPIKDKLFR